MSDKKPVCRDCGKSDCKDWKELALHIQTSEEWHSRGSKIWAAECLAGKDNVKEHKPRQPMSDELKKMVKECVRELSGETKKGLVKCPQCKQLHSMEVEIEYIEDDNWRDDEGRLVILCGSCRESYRIHKKLVGEAR
jgi:uncharacterized protein YbaR (Trm112 family)